MYEILVVTSWTAGTVLLIILMAMFLRIRFLLFNKKDVRVGKVIVDTFLLYSLWSILTIGTLALLLANNQYISAFLRHNSWFTPFVGCGWVLMPGIGIARLLLWIFDQTPPER